MASLHIRRYDEDDDPALMALERQCPRGEPTPFVHYRRRFVDRAALFGEYFLLLAEQEGQIVGAIAAAIKETFIKGKPIRIGYIFDARVSPRCRGQGIASLLLARTVAELQALACEGAYAHIVATNRPSLRLFAHGGFERQRQLRYLTWLPMPLVGAGPAAPPQRHTRPRCAAASPFAAYDLYVDDVACALQPHGLEQWRSDDSEASLLLYDQSRIYQQLPYDAPWPTPEEIARRGRHWRLFHPTGPAPSLHTLFGQVRDRAVTENINKLSMLADVQDPIPAFFYELTSDQREYVIVTRSFVPYWDGTFGARVYCDTREL